MFGFGKNQIALYLLKAVAVAAAYFVAAKLGRFSVHPQPGPAVFWPATGVGLGLLLLWGWRFWPSLVGGAGVYAWASGQDSGPAFVCLVSQLMEVLAGCYFLLRTEDFRISLQRTRDILAFVVLGAMLPSAAGSSLAFGYLYGIGQALAPSFLSGLLVWWAGNTLGVLIVAPVIMLWGMKAPALGLRGWRLAEALLLGGAVLSVGDATFSGYFGDFGFPLFPVLIWAALRFGQRGAALAVLVMTGIGILHFGQGPGPFGEIQGWERRIWFQGFLALISVTGMILATGVRAEAERRLLVDSEAKLRRLAEELERERTRISDLVESIPGMVWEKWVEPDEAEGRVDFVNGYAAQMLGYTEKEWRARSNFWTRILHSEDRERAIAEMDHNFKSGKGGTVQFRWIAKDGRVVWIESHGRVMFDSRGRPAGMRGVNLDITARKEAEEALREALQAREDTLAMVSHDLKNPLNAIKMNASLITRYPDSSQLASKSVNIIGRAADQMDRLVNDLLDAARIEAGKLALDLRRMPAAQVLRDALGLLERQAEEAKLRIELRPTGEETWLHCDPSRILQVLCNILGNAIKFSPAGSVISVEVSQWENAAVFSVTDVGPGVQPDEVSRLFDRYWQAGNPSSKGTGTGLGLFISKAIVEAHGGQIWVENGSSGGSRFSFTVPLLGEQARLPSGPDQLPATASS